MKVLKLVFTSDSSKKHTLTCATPDPLLTAEKVKEEMEIIAQAHLCLDNGEQLYFKPQSAKYVETVETTVFTA
ncbi:DUF2922 domain-containing protein [Lactobacillus sp. DCY120]|uniref:DUF2922 domain-containing protein n=1 Tax=Bombilactobacillus apium TaxID=2675299 RepID=A0A850R7C2_9LACO|nr:DUF2922 domain-containing protein [Bombilactobacillus apium]NVY96562.1 DUF2922 domain-containing protein [Bombilactobacillus apium]